MMRDGCVLTAFGRNTVPPPILRSSHVYRTGLQLRATYIQKAIVESTEDDITSNGADAEV